MQDSTTLKNDVPYALKNNTPYALALKDIVEGAKAWRIWLFLAWQDVQLRYRRSYIGPFWITINMAITISAIGFLYGRLFKRNLMDYYPMLAAGILSWNLISTALNDYIDAFSGAQEYIKQVKLPFFIYILRTTTRNIIIFFHNIVVFIPIIFLFKIKLSLATLSLFFSISLIVLLASVYGLFLGMIGARFRDIGPIIASLVQISFFLTPIIWPVTVLPERYRYLINFNPFAQIVELIRYPLLGKFPSWFALGQVFALFLFGLFFVFFIFAKKRKQIVYWL